MFNCIFEIWNKKIKMNTQNIVSSKLIESKKPRRHKRRKTFDGIINVKI